VSTAGDDITGAEPAPGATHGATIGVSPRAISRARFRWASIRVVSSTISREMSLWA